MSSRPRFILCSITSGLLFSAAMLGGCKGSRQQGSVDGDFRDRVPTTPAQSAWVFARNVESTARFIRDRPECVQQPWWPDCVATELRARPWLVLAPDEASESYVRLTRLLDSQCHGCDDGPVRLGWTVIMPGSRDADGSSLLLVMASPGAGFIYKMMNDAEYERRPLSASPESLMEWLGDDSQVLRSMVSEATRASQGQSRTISVAYLHTYTKSDMIIEWIFNPTTHSLTTDSTIGLRLVAPLRDDICDEVAAAIEGLADATRDARPVPCSGWTRLIVVYANGDVRENAWTPGWSGDARAIQGFTQTIDAIFDR